MSVNTVVFSSAQFCSQSRLPFEIFPNSRWHYYYYYYYYYYYEGWNFNSGNYLFTTDTK